VTALNRREQWLYTKSVRLAAEALRAAQADDWEAVRAAVQRIGDECGSEGLSVALLAWCDTYIDHATDGKPEVVKAPQVAHMDVETGRLERDGDADLREDRRWAGRMLSARALMDHDAWVAAVQDMPLDGAEIGRYFTTLLSGVAGSINGFPRGYALMGRSAQ
jgi:hypothetical protein